MSDRTGRSGAQPFRRFRRPRRIIEMAIAGTARTQSKPGALQSFQGDWSLRLGPLPVTPAVPLLEVNSMESKRSSLRGGAPV